MVAVGRRAHRDRPVPLRAVPAALVKSPAEQLSLTRPTKRVRTHRLTERQRTLLTILRWTMRGVAIDSFPTGYRNPRAACDRLVRRGLVRKLGPGIYVARRVGERSKVI